MARPLRLEFPGAVYHITSRGNARAAIFLDDEDRNLFLGVLAACTQRFNRRHGRAGHVFQGRFKAILLERESYRLELCRYTVLNPVRAKMVEDPADYSWSSYRAMVGTAPGPEWLYTDWLSSQFGKSRTVARERYAAFVAEGFGGTSPWPALKGQVLLGSEHFVESLLPLLEKKGDLKEVPKAQRLAHRPELKAIFTPEARADKKARDSAVRSAYSEFGYPMAAIARELEIHYSTVSKIIKYSAEV